MDRASKSLPKLFLLAIGGHGLVIQVMLLRELMAAFAGNELSAGLTVAVWVVSEALGAWLFGRVRTDSVRVWLRVFGPVAALASVASVLAVILGRAVLGALPGESLNMPGLVSITAMCVSVPAITHGGLFVLGTMLLAQRGPAGIGRGYVWEGIGTVLAAFLAWLFLLPRFSSLAIIALFGIVLAGFPFFVPGPRKNGIVAGVFVILLAVLFGLAGPIERWAWGMHWPGQRVVEVANSPYGKVIRLEREGQRVVVYNGVTALTVPPSDETFVEELAHIPFLVHPDSRHVLLLGSGAALVPYVLRHSVESVTLVQLDPALARADRLCADTVLGRAFADPRFRLVIRDPRNFLVSTTDRFDCIILSTLVPHSLAASRMFALEFYRLCRKSLTHGGIVVLPGPGSGTRLPETRGILLVRKNTLKAAFPQVSMKLADFPMFFASEGTLAFLPETLAFRLVSQKVKTRVLDSTYVINLLDPFRQELFLAGIAERATHASPFLNTDNLPRELFLNMVRENACSSPHFSGFYAGLAKVRVMHLLLLAGLLLLFLIIGARVWGIRFSRAAGVGTSGFAGAAISTLAIFVYQVRFGSVYSGVGLLLATFMLGTVLGGMLGTKSTEKYRGKNVVFLGAEFGLALAAGFLLLLVHIGSPLIFLSVLILAGAALGAQFPIAGASLHRRTIGQRAGLLVALDLTGGFFGALTVALFLVPVFGLPISAATIVFIKLSSAISQFCCPASGD